MTITKQPIIKEKTRILRPSEYELLRENLKLNQQTQLDTLLLTGIRYEEYLRFFKNPKWFDGDFINLPEYAQKKKRRKQLERSIRLNPIGKKTIPYFLKGKKPPVRIGWNMNLKRWAEEAGMDPTGLSAKTTRKTWESWLTFYYPKYITMICLSLGHTNITSIQYYLNMPFTDQDKSGMKQWVEGWI